MWLKPCLKENLQSEMHILEKKKMKTNGLCIYHKKKERNSKLNSKKVEMIRNWEKKSITENLQNQSCFSRNTNKIGQTSSKTGQ